MKITAGLHIRSYIVVLALLFYTPYLLAQANSPLFTATLEPESVRLDQQMVFFSPDVSFTQGENICPLSLNIDSGSISIKNGQYEITPSSVTLLSDPFIPQKPSLRVGFSVPSAFPSGLYDVIVGRNSGCPITCSSCIEIKPQTWTIANNTNTYVPGMQVFLTIGDTSFLKDSSDACYKIIKSLDPNQIQLKKKEAENSTYNPASINLKNGTISMLLPRSISAGRYDVNLDEHSCKITCNDCLLVSTEGIITPWLDLSGDTLIKKQDAVVEVEVRGILITRTGQSAPCLYKFNIANSSDMPVLKNLKSGVVIKSIGTIGELNNFSARFTIPDTIQTGEYKMVLGYGSSCPLQSNKTILIQDANTMAPIKSHKGAFVEQYLHMREPLFYINPPYQCPSKLNPNNITLHFVNGLHSFSAESPTVIPFYPYDSAGVYYRIPLDAVPGSYDLKLITSEGCSLTFPGALVIDSLPFVATLQVSDSIKKIGSYFNSIFITSTVPLGEKATLCPYALKVGPEDIYLANAKDTILVSGMNVNPYNYLQFTLTLKNINPAHAGTYDVIVGTNSECPIRCKGCFTILDPYMTDLTGPALLSAFPDTVHINQQTRILVNGKNINCGAKYIPMTIANEQVYLQKNEYRIYSEQPSCTAGVSASFNIPSDAPTGIYDIHFEYQDTTLSCFQCVTLIAPSISLLNSQGAIRGKTKNIYIKGEGITFTNLPSNCFTNINYGKQEVLLVHDTYTLPADTVYCTDNSYLTAAIAVPVSYPSGKYDVIVKDSSGCSFICQGCYTVPCELFLSQQTRIEGPSSICTENAASYEYSLPSLEGVHYNWNINNGLIKDSSTHSIRVLWDQAAVRTFGSLTATPVSNCGAWESISLSINISPYSDIDKYSISGNPYPCSSDTGLYFLKRHYSAGFNWQVINGTIIKSSGDSVWVSWKAYTHGSVTITDANSCGQISGKPFNIIADTLFSKPYLFIVGNLIQVSEGGIIQWYKDGLLLEGENKTSLQRTASSIYAVVQNHCGRFITNIILPNQIQGNDDPSEEYFQNNAASFILFPNPATTELFLTVYEKTDGVPEQIQLFDMMGNCIKSQSFIGKETAIDISTFANGLYMAKINRKGMSQRFIINK